MASIARFMIHTADLQRPTETKDSIGGISRADTTVKSGLRCCYQELTGEERDDFLRNQYFATGKVFFEDDPSLQEGDRLLFKGQNGTQSRVLEVVRMSEDVVNRGVFWRCAVREQKT